uniref:Uncharacterized protein n=1 Tax=Dendroctonus ponderosae TaxID=77166 RepID=A0AAR5P914_DENPD
MAPLTTDEFVRRLEATEAKLEATLEAPKKANEQVAFWRDRAQVAETLMAASRPEATSKASDKGMEEGTASSSDSEAVEGSAEEAAPPTASKGDSGLSTDSSDGEGFKSPNRRRKRKKIGPMSSREEDKSIKKCALSTGRKPQPRYPRKAAQAAQQTRISTQKPAKEVTKKQAAPAAQQLDDEVRKKQATPATQQTSTRRTKIPPIVLREKSKYDEITRKLMDSKINYGCGITTKEGVRTHPPTEDDYPAKPVQRQKPSQQAQPTAKPQPQPRTNMSYSSAARKNLSPQQAP